MKEEPNYKFNGVRVANRNEVYVSSSIEQLNNDRIDNLTIHHYQNDRWTAVSRAVWGCAGMVPLAGENGGVMCVAIAGEVFEFPRAGGGEDFIESQGEHVDRSPNGPSELVHLRSVERIGASVYCSGFARRVYRRGSGRVWSAVDNGTFVPRERRTKAIGFLALGGLIEDEFYAAGLDGEIWSCCRGKWVEESSPTNVALNTISALSSGLVCIAGMVGIVICGRVGQWSTIPQALTIEPFWSSAVFQDRVYLANNKGVFVLNEAQGELEQVYAGKESASSSYLDARDGVMWSVGDKGIAKTENGYDWFKVPSPGQQL